MFPSTGTYKICTKLKSLFIYLSFVQMFYEPVDGNILSENVCTIYKNITYLFI